MLLKSFNTSLALAPAVIIFWPLEVLSLLGWMRPSLIQPTRRRTRHAHWSKIWFSLDQSKFMTHSEQTNLWRYQFCNLSEFLTEQKNFNLYRYWPKEKIMTKIVEMARLNVGLFFVPFLWGGGGSVPIKITTKVKMVRSNCKFFCSQYFTSLCPLVGFLLS